MSLPYKLSTSACLLVILFSFRVKKIDNKMELSGLNKALHLLHQRKISTESQASTREEILFTVNCILGRMRGCDDEKALSFKVVTGRVVQQISSQCYEVYAVLKNLEKMFEIIEAMEEGMCWFMTYFWSLILSSSKSANIQIANAMI